MYLYERMTLIEYHTISTRSRRGTYKADGYLLYPECHHISQSINENQIPYNTWFDHTFLSALTSSFASLARSSSDLGLRANVFPSPVLKNNSRLTGRDRSRPPTYVAPPHKTRWTHPYPFHPNTCAKFFRQPTSYIRIYPCASLTIRR